MCACTRNSRRAQKGRTDATSTASASARRARILVTVLTIVGISPQLVAPFVTQQCTLTPAGPSSSTPRRDRQHSCRHEDGMLRRRRLSHVAAAVSAVEAADGVRAPTAANPDTSTAAASEQLCERASSSKFHLQQSIPVVHTRTFLAWEVNHVLHTLLSCIMGV